VTKIRRIIEREPSRGRKVARGFGIALLVFGVLGFFGSAVAGTVGGFLVAIFMIVVSLPLIYAGRRRKEVISEQEVTDDKEEEKQKGEQNLATCLLLSSISKLWLPVLKLGSFV
jgi:hypothetical protein